MIGDIQTLSSEHLDTPKVLRYFGKVTSNNLLGYNCKLIKNIYNGHQMRKACFQLLISLTNEG